MVLGFPTASDSCCCHLGITPFLQGPEGQAQDGSGPASDTDGVSRPGGRAEHGARSQQENFPAAGKRRLRPVSQRRAPAGLGLCRRAPVPAEKGVCSRQALSKSLICPANWEVAAHLNHAAHGPEGGDVKSGNSGNPAEAETVKRQSHPLNVELFFFFFFPLNKGNLSALNREGKKLHCLW